MLTNLVVKFAVGWIPGPGDATGLGLPTPSHYWLRFCVIPVALQPPASSRDRVPECARSVQTGGRPAGQFLPAWVCYRFCLMFLPYGLVSLALQLSVQQAFKRLSSGFRLSNAVDPSADREASLFEAREEPQWGKDRSPSAWA